MLALLLVSTLTCAPPSLPDLAGLWETAETSMGGVGGALELRSDGSAAEAVVVLVGFRYSLDEDRLVLRWEQDATGNPGDAATLRFEGEEMIRTLADGTEQRKRRVGPPTAGAPPLVGIWSYPHVTGSRAFERYSLDGTMQFRIPLRSWAGCYQTKADRLTIELSGRKPIHLRFELEGDALRLAASGKSESRAYRRVRGGPWYPIETSVGKE